MTGRRTTGIGMTLALALAGAVGCAGARKEGVPADLPGTGGSGAGGRPGESGPCAIAIAPLAPATFDGLVAGPAATLRVRGLIGGTPPARFDWSWQVTFADGSAVPVSGPIPADPSVIELPLARAGTYTIDVTLTGGKCAAERTITVPQPGGRLATFRLRVTSPATADLPAQDLERQVAGGTPSGGNTLPLSAGIQVPLDVRSATTAAPLAAYVRLTDAATGAVVEGRAPASGAAAIRVAPGQYQMLVVPDGDVAPALFDARSAGLLATTSVLMDDGVAVAGTIRDAAGQAVGGAAVVLRAGALSSTRATSDQAGAFRMRVRAGTFGVTVASSLPDGTLEAELPEIGGVTVADGAAPPPLDLRMAALVTARATVNVVAQDAASLAGAARVLVEAAAPLAGVGSLAAGVGGQALPLAGRVLATPRLGADGAVVVAGLPRGRYRMTVYPGDAGTRDAVTAAEIDLSGGDVGPMPLALASKVMMRGRLLPAAAAAGVRLLAVDDSGLPVAASAEADAGGLFEMAVSPLRRYALRALPRPEQPLARAIFPSVTVTASDLVVQDRRMPGALPYAGRVVDPSLGGVGGALVQAFCTADAPGLADACADAVTPVAEAVTRSDGSFLLMLPDPGVAP